MGKSNMEQDILKVLMSEEQLQKRVREMSCTTVSTTRIPFLWAC